MKRKKVVIVGALGSDFHVYNTFFKDNDEYEVVAFTIAGEQKKRFYWGRTHRFIWRWFYVLSNDDISNKGGYSKEHIRELFKDPHYSGFLSKHSRFEKFPAKIILFIR